MQNELKWTYTELTHEGSATINLSEAFVAHAEARFKFQYPKARVLGVSFFPEEDRATVEFRFVDEKPLDVYLDLGKEIRRQMVVPLGTSLWSPEVNKALPKEFVLVPKRSGYIPENFILEILYEGRPVGECSGQSWVIFYEHGIVIKSINSDHAKAFVIPSET